MTAPMVPGWDGGQAWASPKADLCEGLQADLSALVDGELSGQPAARAIAHLEACAECRNFFDQVRSHVHLHKDLHDTDGLLARFAAMTEGTSSGAGAPAEGKRAGLGGIEARLLVHKLATVFYQLGKAYTLICIDAGFRQRVFEPAVCIERERLAGRGFIDGVAASVGTGVGGNPSGGNPLVRGAASRGGVDWGQKRHLLNGTLERLPRPEDKARRLLNECLEVESDHEQAQIYLALLDLHEGKVLAASRRLEEIFDTAIDPANRGHAASQLGRMHFGEGEYREALIWFRWLRKSGLDANDRRFAIAGFNVGLCYAHLEQPRRALAAFRLLLDQHPDLAGELAQVFRTSPVLRETIDRQPGFTRALLTACPELFHSPDVPSATGPLDVPRRTDL